MPKSAKIPPLEEFLSLNRRREALWSEIARSAKMSPEGILLLWAVATYPDSTLRQLCETLVMNHASVRTRLKMHEECGHVEFIDVHGGRQSKPKIARITQKGREILESFAEYLPR